MSKIISALKTFGQMFWRSVSSFTYYQNLPQLTRRSIVIFFTISFLLFNLIFSSISFFQLENNPELKSQFGQFIDIYTASLSASLNPEATLSAESSHSATLAATLVNPLDASAASAVTELATRSAASNFILTNLPLIFLVIYPILGTILTLPTILLETGVIYFVGRFEKRGLTAWTAAALSIHTTLLVQLLNQIIFFLYPNQIPDVLYLLHWVFIIVVVRKYYPLAPTAELETEKKALDSQKKNQKP